MIKGAIDMLAAMKIVTIAVIEKVKAVKEGEDIERAKKAEGIDGGDAVEEDCVYEVVRSKILSCSKIICVEAAKWLN